jgi:D-xylulose reductase
VKALVLERKGELSLREIDVPLAVGLGDVKIAIHTAPSWFCTIARGD